MTAVFLLSYAFLVCAVGVLCADNGELREAVRELESQVVHREMEVIQLRRLVK